jgi:hypothetical protein
MNGNRKRELADRYLVSSPRTPSRHCSRFRFPFIGGQGRIRTSVARSAADLQSAAINHSATCPSSEKTGAGPPLLPLTCPRPIDLSLEPAMGLEPATFRLQIGCSTIELRRQFLAPGDLPVTGAHGRHSKSGPISRARIAESSSTMPADQAFSAERVRCLRAS